MASVKCANEPRDLAHLAAAAAQARRQSLREATTSTKRAEKGGGWLDQVLLLSTEDCVCKIAVERGCPGKRGNVAFVGKVVMSEAPRCR